VEKKIDYAKIYSPSRLKMFEQCPKSYHFYYLDPVYSKMKNELKKLPHNIWSFHTLGKAVHNAITLFYHSLPQARTKEALKGYLQESWQSEVMWNKKPPLGQWGGFKTLEGEREVYGEALRLLENFFESAMLEPEIEYLPTNDFRRSIKDYQGLITPLDEKFDISGKFDLVIRDGDALHIVDFKTSKNEDSDQFQLRFYKVLAEANFNKPVKKASFCFLKTGNKKEFDLESEKTEEIKKEIQEKIERINATDNFKTKSGKLCKFCLFQTFCPEKEKVQKLVKDTSAVDYSDDLPF